MQKVLLITDGSCIGNPGSGGWAYILKYTSPTSGEVTAKEDSGCDTNTTNNRMELKAAIYGLSALKVPCQVELSTDSEYLRLGITQYITRWKANGWKTANRKPVQNQDLWIELDKQVQRHQITWTWVKGHSGHADNERCDELAQLAARSIA